MIKKFRKKRKLLKETLKGNREEELVVVTSETESKREEEKENERWGEKEANLWRVEIKKERLIKRIEAQKEERLNKKLCRVMDRKKMRNKEFERKRERDGTD